SIAAPHLGIDWGKDDPEFADHIRMHLSRGADSICITSVLDAKAVSNRVDHARTDTGKRRGFPEGGAADAGHCLHQIEHVIARQRKIADLFFREHLSYRR